LPKLASSRSPFGSSSSFSDRPARSHHSRQRSSVSHIVINPGLLPNDPQRPLHPHNSPLSPIPGTYSNVPGCLVNVSVLIPCGFLPASLICFPSLLSPLCLSLYQPSRLILCVASVLSCASLYSRHRLFIHSTLYCFLSTLFVDIRCLSS
jgi:hypothetical protein